MDFLNRKWAFALSQTFFAATAIYLLTQGEWFFEAERHAATPLVLATYPVFLMIMLFFFNEKFGIQNFTHTLALTLMIGYLLTEAHEIPAFIKAYLGAFNTTNIYQDWFVWYTPLSHIYTIIVGFLTLKLAKLKSWKPPLFIFSIMLVALWFIEPIDRLVFRRVFTFALFFPIFLIWSQQP